MCTYMVAVSKGRNSIWLSMRRKSRARRADKKSHSCAKGQLRMLRDWQKTKRRKASRARQASCLYACGALQQE